MIVCIEKDAIYSMLASMRDVIIVDESLVLLTAGRRTTHRQACSRQLIIAQQCQAGHIKATWQAGWVQAWWNDVIATRVY